MKKTKKWLTVLLAVVSIACIAFGTIHASAATALYNADGTALTWSFDANGVSSQTPYKSDGTMANHWFGMYDPANNYSAQGDGSEFVLAPINAANGYKNFVRIDLAGGLDITKPIKITFTNNNNSGWDGTGNQYLVFAIFSSMDEMLAFDPDNWWVGDPSYSQAFNSAKVSFALGNSGVAVTANQNNLLSGMGTTFGSSPITTSFNRSAHTIEFYVGTENFVNASSDYSYLRFNGTELAGGLNVKRVNFAENKLYLAIGGVGEGFQTKIKLTQETGSGSGSGTGTGGGGSTTPQNYTVTFVTNGGTAVTAQSITAGSTATQPANPTKDGYTFQGWYASPTFSGSQFSFSSPITGNITLYAKWTQNSSTGGGSGSSTPGQTYTVTFVTNGGTAVASQTITAGEALNRPINPKKTGDKFLGWYKSATFSGQPVSFPMTVNGNITLYAKWESSEVNSGGGEQSTYDEVSCGSAIVSPIVCGVAIVASLGALAIKKKKNK